MSLAIRLRHRFPSIQLDIAFEVPTPGVTAVFGPSGAGKSTHHRRRRRPAAARFMPGRDRWPGARRHRGRRVAATGTTAHRPGVSGRAAVSAHVGRHQPALRHAPRRAGPGTIRRGGRPAGHRRAAGAPAAHAVRRRAPARRDRPGAAGAAAPAADGRAAGQPGRRAQGGDPALSDAAEDGAAPAGDLRDARAGRGEPAGRFAGAARGGPRDRQRHGFRGRRAHRPAAGAARRCAARCCCAASSRTTPAGN